MDGTSYRMFINPTIGSEKGKVCPRFWHVRETSLSKHCNMKLVNYTTDDAKLTLQILENTKSIKAGEEFVYYRKLVYYKKAGPKQTKNGPHMPPLLEQKVAKKQRTE